MPLNRTGFFCFSWIFLPSLALCLLVAGCGKKDEQPPAPPLAATVAAPPKASIEGAVKATDYRQGLCQSMQESLNRLAAAKLPADATADLASIRFILNNMMGAFPAESIAPHSRLKTQALAEPQKIVLLRDDAAKAAQAVSSAKTTVAFAKSRIALSNSCVACHGALTTGIQEFVAFKP